MATGKIPGCACISNGIPAGGSTCFLHGMICETTGPVFWMRDKGPDTPPRCPDYSGGLREATAGFPAGGALRVPVPGYAHPVSHGSAGTKCQPREREGGIVGGTGMLIHGVIFMKEEKNGRQPAGYITVRRDGSQDFAAVIQSLPVQKELPAGRSTVRATPAGTGGVA